MTKKICFFTSHFDFPRQRLMDYYERIKPKNTEYFLFCEKGNKEKFNLKKTEIIEYQGKIKVISTLRNFCKKNKIDIVTNISGRPKTALVMALATFGLKTKNIFRDHANPRISELIFLSSFQCLVDRVVACAPDLASKIKKAVFLNPKKVYSLFTAIDTDFFKPLNKKLLIRKKLGIGQKEKVVVFVGRIQYLKGSDLLLEAIKNNPDKKFILIGQLMDENYNFEKLNNAIHIPKANAEELLDFYNASDLCLFLSRREGLGLAYREAMACGIPAIVSDIEAIRFVKSAIKVPLKTEKTQIELDKFFNLSEKEKQILSNQTRETILKEHSEKSLRSGHLKYLFSPDII